MIEQRFSEDLINPLEDSVRELLASALLAPVRDIFSRPAKLIRGQMVRAGLLLADGDQLSTPEAVSEANSRCDRMAEVLEAIHAGSLIVDDIQDGSKVRRGSPTLHEIYGMPIALNAGNWLYFWPMQWIRQLELPMSMELGMYRLYHDTLLRAHLGQAIDVGTKIDRLSKDRIVTVCMASLELKTGALMALALAAGAVLGGSSPARLRALQEFGKRFGVALQMFDDLGNINLPQNDPKRLEDLRLRRPTWIWAAAAAQSSEPEYQRFQVAVAQLPDESALTEWYSNTDFLCRARKQARDQLEEAIRFLVDSLPSEKRTSEGFLILKQLAHKIEVSYG